MEFKEAPRVFPDMPIWRAIGERFTFVISEDAGEFAASAKPRGALPFDGTIHNLGFHKSYAAAHAACDAFNRSNADG